MTYHGGVVILISVLLNIMLEWVALLQIQEVIGSNPGLETGCYEVCCEFPQSLKVKCQTPPQIGPQLRPSIAFQIHYSLLLNLTLCSIV